jgi:hypothetical protein
MMNRNVNVAVRKGASAEILVRRVVSGKDLVLDLQALSVDGHRYFVTADDYDGTRKHKGGVGPNQRTGVMVGGGTFFWFDYRCACRRWARRCDWSTRRSSRWWANSNLHPR